MLDDPRTPLSVAALERFVSGQGAEQWTTRPWVVVAWCLALFGSLGGCAQVLSLDSLKDGPPSDGGLSSDATVGQQGEAGIDGAAPDVVVAIPEAGDAPVITEDAGPQPLGASCASATQCTSGHCVDGVCCDGSCDGQCEACDVGSGGMCTPVSGTPHGSRAPCLGVGTACEGTCDPSNSAGCTYPGNSTTCVDAGCSNGTETVTAGCNGSGSCPMATTVACSNPAACNSASTGCANACNSDSQCPSSAPYCNSGACLTTKANGETCQGAADCTNGNCVDGYCCDGACEGQCQACDIAGSVGACTQVGAGQPHGTRQPCTGAGTACGGTCTTQSATACTFSTGSCGSPTCSISTLTPAGTCAQGACNPGTPAGCPNGLVCASTTACFTACTSDGDCVAADYCASNGQCTPQKAQGSQCNEAAGADCATAGCHECAANEACVDGYCCNSSCTGQCQACDLSGSQGTCTTVPSGQPHGSRPACTAVSPPRETCREADLVMARVGPEVSPNAVVPVRLCSLPPPLDS